MAIHKNVQFMCPGCKTTHIIPKDNLEKIILPDRIEDGEAIYAYVKPPCGNFVELSYLRDEWNKGQTSGTYLFTENEYYIKIKKEKPAAAAAIAPVVAPVAAPLVAPVAAPVVAPVIAKDNLSYFRPMNKESAVKFAQDKKLINGKYNTVDFNFAGRTGTFIYNNDALVFVSNSEQNASSLERIAYAAENLSYQILEKRQSQAKKNKDPLRNDKVQMYFIDKKDNTDEFNDILEKRKEKYAGAAAPKPIKKINDTLLVLKKNIISSIKHTPQFIARRILFSYLPIVGISYAVYGGVKLIKSYYDIKTNAEALYASIQETNESINGRDIEAFNTQKAELEEDLKEAEAAKNKEYVDIAPNSPHYNNLKELEAYMLANGAQKIDLNGDGLAEGYYIPSTEQTTYDPIADGVIKPEDVGQENYNDWNNAWNELQEYNAAELSFLRVQADLANLMAGNTDLPNLEATLNGLVEQYDIAQNGISAVRNMFLTGGAIIGGIFLGAYLGKKYMDLNNKMFFGSKLRVLKEDELQSLYTNDIKLEAKLLTDEPYTPLPAEDIEILKEKDIKLKKELKSKKNDLEELVKKCAEFDEVMVKNKENSKIYDPWNDIYVKWLAHLGINPTTPGIIDEMEKDYKAGKLKINFKHATFAENGITQKEFEENLIHLKNWSLLLTEFKETNGKYELIKNSIPAIDREITDLSVAVSENEMNINNYETLLNSKALMLDQLVADPELIFTKNYEKFGGNYKDGLVSAVSSNKSDLDVARKAIKKIKKKMIKEAN